VVRRINERVFKAMSSLPGLDLANIAVQHDMNGEWQLAMEHYTRAADVIEYASNAGQAPPEYKDLFPQMASKYRARAAELVQELQVSRADSNSHSTQASVEATTNSMFRKLKSSASNAARATKETATSVGQGAKSAASAVYTTTSTAVRTNGSLSKQVARSAAHGLGMGFGFNVGNTAGATVSRVLFPAPPHRR
jgi:hypothetical protein